MWFARRFDVNNFCDSAKEIEFHPKIHAALFIKKISRKLNQRSFRITKYILIVIFFLTRRTGF